MPNLKNTDDKDVKLLSAKDEIRAKVERLCACDRILSASEIADFPEVAKYDFGHDEFEGDHCNDDLEAEYLKLCRLLDLPEGRHSLTKIETNLPRCLKYGFRSGMTHMSMPKFSPLTRGLQGPAIGVAAIGTSELVKAHCWNEPVIDRVLEDGDTYYTKSYEHINTDDRRTLTLLDFKEYLDIRDTHRITIKVDDPIYTGTFRSETPKVYHIAKALDLFFKKYDAGILTSKVLNCAIWKNGKYFNIFDAQARLENCEVADEDSEEEGSAKLIIVPNFSGVLFIILEKSKVENEPFVLYGINILDVRKISDLPPEGGSTFGEPKRRPSGYNIHEEYRAVIQGSYHLLHPILPKEFQGRGHLIIAVAALIYTKLVSASKWTKVMVDLIFNQSNIYLTDLVRVLGKELKDGFDLSVKDLLCDIILGVYTTKVKFKENAYPGEGKKKKTTMDVGLREFFAAHTLGIVELKKTYYAIWKEKNKYYLLDPFACDEEGFRVDAQDPDERERYLKAAACVTMNGSINQLFQTILENTQSKEKDPIVIHELSVLYIKTGNEKDGTEKVVFREKQTNRRPERPPSPPLTEPDECITVIDTLPRPRSDEEPEDERVQYPEMMDRIEIFVETFDDDTVDNEDNKSRSERVSMFQDDSLIKSYKIANPHRLLLKGTKSCLDEKFHLMLRGRQGLIISLVALTEKKQENEVEWINTDVDRIINIGHKTYKRIAYWILDGAEGDGFDGVMDDDSYEDEMEGLEMYDNNDDDEVPEELPEIDSFVSEGLDYIDLTMLPVKMKFGKQIVNLTFKMNVIVGEANPFANLGEALESYFEQYNEMVLENKKLSYAIWKKDDKYFVFNPYGTDNDGWRNATDPSALAVVDSINELVNLFYGLLEFNDPYFSFHVVNLKLEGDEEVIDDKDPAADTPEETEAFERFKTKFLPVTQEDVDKLLSAEEEVDISITEIFNENSAARQEKSFARSETKSLKSIAKSEVKSLKSVAKSEEKSLRSTAGSQSVRSKVTAVLSAKQKSIVLFREPREPHPMETPPRLNLALVTGIVKIEHTNEEEHYEENLEVFYERLKYMHPPPFVRPPNKNLCDLLDVKLASKSAYSLISRFSINSKLAMKEKADVVPSKTPDAAIVIDESDAAEQAKLIKLPPKLYFLTKSLPSGLTPIRAINEKFLRDKTVDEANEEECRRKKYAVDKIMVPKNMEEESMQPILPTLIPLGPPIKTPKIKNGYGTCPDARKAESCKLTAKEKDDRVLKKLVCSTENLLFEMIFPDFRTDCEEIKKACPEKIEIRKVKKCRDEIVIPKREPELRGFKPTDDDYVGVINANMCLKDRFCIDDTHYKPCFFSAILCILAKINVSVHEFRGGFLDRFIYTSTKIDEGAGRLRYKMQRWFRNFNIVGVKCHVIVKQVQYADPETHEPDALIHVLKNFFEKNQTGILVFQNVAYAFWTANDMFYVFDPYSCDENGRAAPEGGACLMQFCCFDVFLDRIIENTGDMFNKPYRLYTLLIAHLEKNKKKLKKLKKPVKRCTTIRPNEEKECEPEPEPTESETSLIELPDWAREKTEFPPLDPDLPSFQPVKNYNVSALEVKVLHNEITRPILAPFVDNERMRLYDRKFFERTVLAEPMDMCVMAWAQIYEPPIWSVRTIEGLFEASKEYTLDSVLACQDTTIPKMTDDLLPEFSIANYSFRVAFAPLHTGRLYAVEGWNLAMSLDKIFESPIYTGAVIVCENAHIGVMKKGERYYAWWLVLRTKNFRIIASEDVEDFLKLIVKEMNQPWETEFNIRIVTISYAKIVGPDCSDLEGLHESMMPSTSVPEIHRKNIKEYDIHAVFRPTDRSQVPVYILGSTALLERDSVTEPKVQRCYFAAVFAVMMKRDIMQNPLPGMIDKILCLADSTYKMFEEPKYHTEHILKDLSLMDRLFDLRDCASQLYLLIDEKQNKKNFYAIVKKQMVQHFKKCTSGIIHFSNCCYGFWYSDATNCYYYLDPYQCDEQGKRVSSRGKSCLCIFSSVSDMIMQMCYNAYEETTGFFIHRIHVESVNSSPFDRFQEDPIWNYLDYHWSYRHIGLEKPRKGKKRANRMPIIVEDEMKPRWKNYLIEVPNMLFSVWGTIGSFDERFGKRAGKAQAAIGIATFAMRDLCHPSEWTAAVLDSAVLCGDQFYRNSRKASPRCLNKFNLLESLRVSPYIWNLDFEPDICGILYGTQEQLNLCKAVELALTKSDNLLLQCKNKIIAMLQTSDAYYAVDSTWTGPPLFLKGRGAIYSVRCKNANTLIYVVIKMLNTNQRLDFSITPVKVICKQEGCQASEAKPRMARKKILDKPARSAPGETMEHDTLVCGSLVVPDEDSYLCYSRNLKFGLARGKEFEHEKQVHEAIKRMDVCKKAFRIREINKEKEICQPCGIEPTKPKLRKAPKSMSLEDTPCVGLPRVLNLANEGIEPDSECAKKLLDKQPFEVKKSFVCEETRDYFDTYNEQMAKEVYKRYKHYLYKEKENLESSDEEEEEPKGLTLHVSYQGSMRSIIGDEDNIGDNNIVDNNDDFINDDNDENEN